MGWLGLFVLIFGLLAFAAWVLERAEPNPITDERRMAYRVDALNRHDRGVAAGAVLVIVALFVIAAAYPQGTP